MFQTMGMELTNALRHERAWFVAWEELGVARSDLVVGQKSTQHCKAIILQLKKIFLKRRRVTRLYSSWGNKKYQSLKNCTSHTKFPKFHRPKNPILVIKLSDTPHSHSCILFNIWWFHLCYQWNIHQNPNASW